MHGFTDPKIFMSTPRASTLWRRFVLTLEMIKFEHSVFALPFALTGALLAWRDLAYSTEGLGLRLLFFARERAAVAAAGRPVRQRAP